MSPFVRRLQVLPLPTAAKHDLSAQKPLVSMPQSAGVRHRRSDLQQQVEVMADVMGDENVLHGADSGAVMRSPNGRSSRTPPARIVARARRFTATLPCGGSCTTCRTTSRTSSPLEGCAPITRWNRWRKPPSAQPAQPHTRFLQQHSPLPPRSTARRARTNLSRWLCILCMLCSSWFYSIFWVHNMHNLHNPQSSLSFSIGRTYPRRRRSPMVRGLPPSSQPKRFIMTVASRMASRTS
jgi:hypothetical protein